MFECIRSFLVLHFVLSLYRQLITKSLIHYITQRYLTQSPIGLDVTFAKKQIEPFVGGHRTSP